MRMVRALLMLLTAVLVVGCAPDGGDPAEAVERYLEARVRGERNTVTALLCSEMEAQADREARTFETVSGVTIENMDCKSNTGQNSVTCTGVVRATYGTEDTEFPLGTYRVTREDGEWKWCGEA